MCIFFHKWNDWSPIYLETAEGEWINGKKCDYQRKYQYRTCRKCSEFEKKYLTK